MLKLPATTLAQTIQQSCNLQRGTETDVFGRDFTGQPALAGSFYAIQVTGALFHTQGGLCVNQNAQVMKQDDTTFAQLHAGDRAARGVSGPHVPGYL